MADPDREDPVFDLGYHTGYRDGVEYGDSMWRKTVDDISEASETAVGNAFDRGYRLGVDEGFRKGTEEKSSGEAGSDAGAVNQYFEDGFRLGVGAAIIAVDTAVSSQALERHIPAEHIASIQAVLDSLASVLRKLSADFGKDTDERS
ncbi:hypothetical protein [Mycolicibacterium aichiense]|uniref:Uncharacterized protein n=1 Tax=Mycolicibacterium aichiense TaxID=1799 RepID=A0AAD1HJX7_9MYCO|nr:hypothetical protein [Mycolicibacterium aichiense]MCV7017649.1 hypothetical protein [Mycolicibacterium aichiense]BBX06742.1 hypothetical protein MAIC_15450 [Mycolicibacterium aichiense]STZ23921.1 Uncharacterised protein [Mycolicibacterium aichiense]